MNSFNFENINLYTFDLSQYNFTASKIEYTLFANHEGKTYFTILDIDTWGLNWVNKKWAVPEKYIEGYIEIGMIHMHNLFAKNKDKENELF